MEGVTPTPEAYACSIRAGVYFSLRGEKSTLHATAGSQDGVELLPMYPLRVTRRSLSERTNSQFDVPFHVFFFFCPLDFCLFSSIGPPLSSDAFFGEKAARLP